MPATKISIGVDAAILFVFLTVTAEERRRDNDGRFPTTMIFGLYHLMRELPVVQLIGQSEWADVGGIIAERLNSFRQRRSFGDLVAIRDNDVVIGRKLLKSFAHSSSLRVLSLPTRTVGR